MKECRGRFNEYAQALEESDRNYAVHIFYRPFSRVLIISGILPRTYVPGFMLSLAISELKSSLFSTFNQTSVLDKSGTLVSCLQTLLKAVSRALRFLKS
jgi:hypothetical protein